SILAGLGGGIIGGTFGWNLAEKEENRMSGGTQIALYGIGGALAVSSLFAALTWHNPADDFADAYNRSLRIELGMPGGRAFDPLPPIDLRSLKPDAVMVMRDPWSTSR
ncbi:MAG TPA: hypothetical protein VJT73_05790, partial [Polyangiaceae bacterium]|nr:hypothetical protein [Polyangiaceae bacterium]